MAQDIEGKTEFDAGVEAIEAGDMQEALKRFHHACAIAPTSQRYQAYRAWAKYQLSARNGDLETDRREAQGRSCRALIVEALERDPSFDAGFVLLGSILIAEGDVERATNAFARALEIDPENMGARLGLERCQKIQ